MGRGARTSMPLDRELADEPELVLAEQVRAGEVVHGAQKRRGVLADEEQLLEVRERGVYVRRGWEQPREQERNIARLLGWCRWCR